MNAPRISVIIPAYNAEDYIEASIRSVLDQTLRDLECLVIDDGSKDGTLAILKRLEASDARLRVVSRPNKGLVATLNELLGLARGDYLARMDADDLCLPERLERQLAHHEAKPELLASGTGVHMVDPENRVLKSYVPPLTHEALVERLLQGDGGALVHPTLFLRTETLRQLGGYSSDYAGYGEDWDLFVRLSQLGRLDNLAEPLLRYRIHAKSYNHTRSAVQIEKFLAKLNLFRVSLGQPPLASWPNPRSESSLEEVYCLWATWAIEGGELATARSLILKAIRRRPFSRKFWKLLKYCLSLQTKSRKQDAH